jgi:ABC-type dipeptide/oligopeptide/nickel transport system permease subunit
MINTFNIPSLLKKLRKLNWYLVFGGIFVALITFIAIFGPNFAPHDPMKENYALEVDGLIRTPPYRMFDVPGYILGTDRFGRDLFSRLLFAVRPTMIMVLSVAGVRLILGVALGMATGWLEGRKGRFLEPLYPFPFSSPPSSAFTWSASKRDFGHSSSGWD